MKVEPLQLTGSLVSLLPIKRKHAEGYALAGQKEEIWPYMAYPVDSLKQAQHFIQEDSRNTRRG